MQELTSDELGGRGGSKYGQWSTGKATPKSYDDSLSSLKQYLVPSRFGLRMIRSQSKKKKRNCYIILPSLQMTVL